MLDHSTGAASYDELPLDYRTPAASGNGSPLAHPGVTRA